MEYVGLFVAASAGAFAVLAALTAVYSVAAARKLQFRGKHVLITGGSKGLGKAMAAHVVKRGAHVTIVARDEAALSQAKRELEGVRASSEQKVMTLSADVANEAAVANVFKQATAASGVPQFVFSTAGYAHPGYFLELPADVFKKQMEVNYLGGLYVAKHAAEGMVKNGVRGDIVFVSSVASFVAYVGFAAYAPSKYALRGLTDALRNELTPHGINITMFYPPTMNTDGLAAENKLKPKVAADIEGSVDMLTAEQASNMLFAGMARREYAITAEPIGYLARVIGSGVSQRSNVFLETLLAPIATIVSSVMAWYFDLLARQDVAKNASRWTKKVQ